MIRIHTSAYFYGAVLLLVLPLDWVLSLLFSIGFHELCHILVLKCMKGKIITIRISIGGCVIDSSMEGEKGQFLSILAGPLGSLSLLLLHRIFPKIAVCGLLHGLYNLLPVFPLDGGHLLRMMLHRISPQNTDKIMDWFAAGSCILSGVVAVWLIWSYPLGIWPLFASFIWSLRFLPGKRPCKQVEIRVQ